LYELANRRYLIQQVTPFPAPGSAAAIKEATTGIFRPVPPFGALSAGALLKLFLTSDPWSPYFYCKPLSDLQPSKNLTTYHALILAPVVPSNAVFFGSILAFQRFSAKSLELLRRTEDVYNDLFGFAMIYPYYTTILNHSEKRLLRHNRLVGGTVLLAVLYANLLA
jgi:hypothetical protein